MTTREKGTGLGLAIVTKIIEEHGGRIELLDSPEVQRGGHGALIRVTLPAIAGGRRRGSGARGRGRSLMATMGSDILIVDDETDIREIVSGILSDEGHGTRTAADADGALAEIAQAAAVAGLPRHLAAGQQDRRAGAPRHHQARTIPTCRSS